VTNIYLVRHGEAQLPWSEAENSGLSAAGKPQAEDVIEALGDVPSLRVVSSPLQRAQETALPLSRHFGVTAEIDDRFRDVPLDENRAIRKAWLVDVASMCWHEVDDAVTAWRNSAWNGMLSAQRDTVIFTHFMLINAMVSRASADERLACFEPGLCLYHALGGDRATTLSRRRNGAAALTRFGAASTSTSINCREIKIA
jgi:broad specificity phosphatase PhoE